jgi:hypothetical protein
MFRAARLSIQYELFVRVEQFQRRGAVKAEKEMSQGELL